MSKIIIGTRRSNPFRTVRVVAITALTFTVAIAALLFVYRGVVAYEMPSGSVPSESLRTHVAKQGGQTLLQLGDSSLSFTGRLRVMRLVGQPHTLGAVQGRLHGARVTEVNDTLAPSLALTVPRGRFFRRWAYGARFRWSYRLLDDGIPGHQLVEIAGLVRGVRKAGGKSGYEDSVHTQALLDLGRTVSWSAGHRYRALARSLSYITTLRVPSGDRLLVGRSFALPGISDGGRAIADNITVSFVRGGEDVISYASIGWPGLIGVVSGINAEGLAIMVHPVRTADVRVSRRAQPVALIAREILENARSLDDAIKVLEKANPLGAAAFVVVDGNARTWAVIERSPGNTAVTRSPSPPVVTDILRADSFADDPENDRARRAGPATMRAQRVARMLRAKPPQTPFEAAGVLRDNHGAAGQPLPLGHRGAPNDVSAVHAALFDASGMVLWVADGPGAGGVFRAFDLRYELRKEGARPAPPADLPEQPDADPSATLAVLQARRHLRAARRTWSSGNKRRGQELVQRALARAPDLPEALELAGDFARLSRDTDNMRRYYRRLLAVGADDIAAAEEIKALLKSR